MSGEGMSSTAFIGWLYQHCFIKHPQAIHNGRKPTARRRR